MWDGDGQQPAARALNPRVAGSFGAEKRDYVPVGSRASANSHWLATALNIPLAHLGVQSLIGMAGGKQRRLPSIILDGQPCKFSVWFPHVGIAVDLEKIPEEERQRKNEILASYGARYFWYQKVTQKGNPQFWFYPDHGGEPEWFTVDLLCKLVSMRRGEET